MTQQNQAITSPLFRPEVTAAQSQQWLGTIRLAQPISAWLIAVTAALIAAALIIFICMGSITAKARVTGITTPVAGSISITTPNAGLLVQTFLYEGERVKAGQVLFELSTERQGDKGEITALIAQQQATRQQMLENEQITRATQSKEKKQALAQRLVNLNTEMLQLATEITLAQRRQNLAQESVKKYETLQASGFVSAVQTQQKQEDVIDIEARISNLQRSKLQLEANKLAIFSEQDALKNKLSSEQAQLKMALASLQQEIAENYSRKASRIIAPKAGTISGITNQVGQSINAGQVLATLIPEIASPANEKPNNQLEVQLYAPSRTAGFVAPGQQVLIRYQAYPYQKFGLQQGVVSDVSRTPFAPNELPPSLASTILSNAQQNILGFNSNEALYRIKVKLAKQTIAAYGKEQMLKPGMTLEANVLQDRRSIWEWIIEPALAVSKTLGSGR